MQSTFRALKQLTGVLPVQLASSLSCATGIRKIRLYATPLDRSGRHSPQRKARRSRESGDEEDESEDDEEEDDSDDDQKVKIRASDFRSYLCYSYGSARCFKIQFMYF